MTQWSDQKIEDIVGTLLRVGVILAGSVVLAGGIVFLLRHGNGSADYHVFRGEPAELTGLSQIVKFAFGGHGRGIIQLGLLLLIATPVARVAFAVAGFAMERDWMYVSFTLIVFSVLCYSLFGF